MKKTILAILAACALVSSAHAQTAVVVERPSLLSDLAETVGALVALPIVLPIAVAEGVVSGTAEAADTILHGRREVYVVPRQQVVTPAPVVVAPQQVVTPAPVVVAPQQVVTPAPVVVAPQQVVTPAPVVVAPQPQVTTIVTTMRSHGGVVMTTGVPVVPPPVEYRVAPSPAGRTYIVRRR